MTDDIDGGAHAPAAPEPAPAPPGENPHEVVPGHYLLLRPVLASAAGKIVRMSEQAAAMHGADIRPATRSDLSLHSHEPVDFSTRQE